ncbi:MAG: sigma-70 family RNA polymerase sigma factor [Actinomycetota bacterium]
MAMVETTSDASQSRRFQAMYRAHYEQVYIYFKRRTDIESARDGTADTFLVAWRRLDDVPDGDGTLPWLYGTARRVLSNQWRSRRRSDSLRDRLFSLRSTEHVPGPEAAVVSEPHIEAVTAALEQLRDPDREVIRLAEWEGLSHREIGVVMECSTHAVDQRMHRALRRLAGRLERDSGFQFPVAEAEGHGGVA